MKAQAGRLQTWAIRHPPAFRHVLNFYPPFRGTGAWVTFIADDWSEMRIRIPLSWRTRNYVGTIFGGSLYAGLDPHFMFMLMHRLGPEYLVWDKASEIEFVKPGRGTVHAEFNVEDSALDEIRAATAGGEKYLRWFPVDVIDAQGEVVARIRKQLYVRLKPRHR